MRRSITGPSFLFVVALLLPLAAAGCSSLSTFTDYDLEADFDSLETYDWLATEPDEVDDELTARRVRSAVDECLSAAGYRVESTEPDFLVAFQVSHRDRLRITEHGMIHGYGYGMWDVRHVDVHEFQEGMLVLDVLETDTRKLIWRGTARGVIQERLDPAERTARIREAVAALLEEFPP